MQFCLDDAVPCLNGGPQNALLPRMFYATRAACIHLQATEQFLAGQCSNRIPIADVPDWEEADGRSLNLGVYHQLLQGIVTLQKGISYPG